MVSILLRTLFPKWLFHVWFLQSHANTWCGLLNFGNSSKHVEVSHYGLNLNFLMTSGFDHLFTCLFVIRMSSLVISSNPSSS